MPRLWRIAIGLSPVLVACAFVLSSYVVNAVPIWLLWRPLLASVAVAIGIQLVAVMVAGWVRGSFWAFVIVSALTGMVVLAGASVLALTIFTAIRSARGTEYRLAATLALGVAFLLSSVLVARGMTNGAFDWSAPPTTGVDLDGARPGPSIHLLMLDGYPRQDILAQLGYDNAPFLHALEDRGFDVYPDSHSSYDRTAFTLLTMLSMRHLTDIDHLWTDVPDAIIEQTRIVSRALQDVPVLEGLESVGYETRVLQSPIVHVPMGDADLDETVGTANNFELDLPHRSLISGVVAFLGFGRDQQRAHVKETLAAFAAPPDERSFTLAHVLSPHAPYVLGPDGDVTEDPPCYPATCSIFESDIGRLGWSETENWERFTDQVDELNGLVLGAVDDLVARDPEAVVVIFSDHGARIPGNVEGRLENLLVARTPGHSRLLGTSPTTINILPAVFDAYLGTTIGRLPDTLYAAGEVPWLAVEVVEPAE